MTKLSSRQQMPMVFEIVEVAVARGEWETARRWLEVFIRARPRCAPEWRDNGLAKNVDDLVVALKAANKTEIRKRVEFLPREFPAQNHHMV